VVEVPGEGSAGATFWPKDSPSRSATVRKPNIAAGSSEPLSASKTKGDSIRILLLKDYLSLILMQVDIGKI